MVGTQSTEKSFKIFRADVNGERRRAEAHLQPNSSNFVFALGAIQMHFDENRNGEKKMSEGEQLSKQKFQGLAEQDEQYAENSQIRSSKKFKIDPEDPAINKLDCTVKMKDTADFNSDGWYMDKKILTSPKIFQLEKMDTTKSELFLGEEQGAKFNFSTSSENESVQEKQKKRSLFGIPEDSTSPGAESDKQQCYSGVQNCFLLQQTLREVHKLFDFREDLYKKDPDHLARSGQKRDAEEAWQDEKEIAQIRLDSSSNDHNQTFQEKGSRRKVTFDPIERVETFQSEQHDKSENLEAVETKKGTDQNIVTEAVPHLKQDWEALLSKMNNMQKVEAQDKLKTIFMEVLGNQSHITKAFDKLENPPKMYDERFRRTVTDTQPLQMPKPETDEEDDRQQFTTADECVCRGQVTCAPQKFTKINTNITLKNCDCSPKENSNNSLTLLPNTSDDIYGALTKIQYDLEMLRTNFIDKFINHIDKDAKEKTLLHSNILTNYKTVDKLLNKCKCFEIVRHYEIKRIEKDILQIKTSIDKIFHKKTKYKYMKFVLQYIPLMGMAIFCGIAYYKYHYDR